MQVVAQLVASIEHANTATVFNYPHGSTQGLLNCIQTVGGLVSKFGSVIPRKHTLIIASGLILGPYMADYGGRKWTIFRGFKL